MTKTAQTQTTTYIIEIDQSKVDAPNFPRDVAWWQQWLPIWMSDRLWYQKPEGDEDWSNISVDPLSGAVVITTDNRSHAQQIMQYLNNSPLSKRFSGDAILLKTGE